jgi:hypothetical protein
MELHELRTWPGYFEGLVTGKKTWEIRRDDRHFEVGDLLYLSEYDPEKNEYTGRMELRKVTMISKNLPWVQDGYVVMSIVPGKLEVK